MIVLVPWSDIVQVRAVLTSSASSKQQQTRARTYQPTDRSPLLRAKLHRIAVRVVSALVTPRKFTAWPSCPSFSHLASSSGRECPGLLLLPSPVCKLQSPLHHLQAQVSVDECSSWMPSPPSVRRALSSKPPKNGSR